MKRCYSLLLAFITALTAMAYDFEVDGIYYSISSSTDKTVSVTYRSYSKYSGEIIIPEMVTYNDTEYSVKEIGDYAFRGCTGLTSVIIPNSVTSIGYYAFDGCSGLPSVTIPNSVTEIGSLAFYMCTGLTSVTIPESVTSIGESAFSRCTGLTSVTIPESVTSIGSSAFSGCSSLMSVTIPNSVTEIGSSAFSGCSGLSSVAIPNSVTEIGNYAFSGCTGLTSVTIPGSVTGIGNYAFSGCTILTTLKIEDGESTLTLGDNWSSEALFSDCPLETVYMGRTLSYRYSPFGNQTKLTSLTIGDKVTEIGNYAFGGCTGLTSVVIPNSVTSIGNSAFSGCKGLTSVTIPNSVTEIGSSAFYMCTGLTSVTIPNSVTEIGDYAFYVCSGLTSVTIPNSVTEIGSLAFYMCTGLTSVTIPESVTSIGESAFSRCTGLTSVTILESVTEIGESAFSGCSSLMSVTIPNSVTEIGDYAFNGCSALTTIISNAVTPPAIGSNSFSYESYKYALVTVPAQSFSGYKEKWSSFDHLIKGAEKSAEYHIDQAGGLINMISPDEAESITSLKLTGTLNGTDLLTINRMINLIELDISGCDIVSGGMPYYEADNERFGTEDNTLGYFWIYNLNIISDVKLPETLKTIGTQAFASKKRLTSITIPASVNSIMDNAFSGCSGLSNLIIEEGESTLTLGNNGYNYGSYNYNGLFSDCPLKTVYMGRTLSYSNSPFRDQTKLTSLTIGDKVTEIGSSGFSGCSGLTSVTIPNSVTEIGDYSFSGCTGLTSVTIPNSVTSLGSSAFSGCSGLSSVAIPNSVTEIGSSAFFGCSGLTSVAIPNSVTEIGSSAFSGCSGLTSVIIPNSVTTLGYYAFYGCTGLTSVAIPNSVTKIQSGTFKNCKALGSISLPNTLKLIGGEAFSGCTSLEHVAIPNPTESIGSSAFDGCSGLKELTLPGSVKSIGESAFAGCRQLGNVYVINPIPPVIESSTFDATTLTAATLHVPEDSRAINWVHPYWGKFKKIDSWTVGTTTELVAENVSYHITSEADATVEISAVALGGSRAAATTVKIPSTVKFNDKVYTVAGVANNGFAGAPVSEVELPATVNYVGLAAFKGCEALTKVTVRNTLPPSADVSSFDEATYANAKLSVVEEAADAYRKHSVWGLFDQTDAPAEEPADPSDPSDPTDPVDPSDPSDPTDPSGIDGVSDAEAARPIAVAGGIDFEGVDGNTVVEIYSISGQRLYAGPARRKDLAAGYYIVRIGRHAFKIMVK